MRTAAALHCRGPGHDIADFRVIWGRFVFFIKNRLFSILISIKSGLAVVWTHFRPKNKIKNAIFPP